MQTWQTEWDGRGAPALAPDADLVFVHGSRESLQEADLAAASAAFPGASIVGCSGAGEILDAAVVSAGIAVTAVRFDKASAKVQTIDFEPDADSAVIGRQLVEGLQADGLRHVIVFSDGLHVNGTQLVEGMTEGLPAGVSITGGLAGDGDRFEETVVVADGRAGPDRAVAIGLYGDIAVGYGSLGGWDPFGPPRTVTRSEGNVLYELDGRPALDLYKQYLGEHADGLPATGLLFPLYLPQEGGQGVVRTILGIDEKDASMTFAGDVPQGAAAQLMKANFDRLIDGAEQAGQRSLSGLDGAAELSLLISCVGRRLVLKQRVEDELDAVREAVGPDGAMMGFYSYGEICPSAPGADCQLHNQTMTVTTLREV